jgi:predicted ATPase/DNA-binding CsgD family transcriptional regulator
MRPRRARRSTALPAQPGALIGRARELEDAARQLSATDVRLLTITGPPGAGKTRLALNVAGQLADLSPDGVWFVDLAPIHDARLLPTAIGRAAGVREQRGELAQARVKRHIGQRQLLLLLDNFEQILPAAAAVADLLASCPNLKVLVTSRAPLRLRWEHVLPLPPLAVPDRRRLPAPAELAQIPAVALFVERAQAVDPAFRIGQDNADAVAEICVRLDGLPLAIELAAAHSNVLAPAEILTRLRRRFDQLAGGTVDLLAGGAIDLPTRQQSLQAAFDWGYDLLSPPDRALFRALSVFSGGFTQAGALAVAGSDDLTALVQHSLVRREGREPGEDVCFRMLETLRTYALDRLQRAAEWRATAERHARFMVDITERAAPELLGAHQATWLARLEREHDNLAAALRWTVDTGAIELSLRLAGGLWRFWWLHGHLSEGMAWMDAVLSASRDASEPLLPARAAALNGAGVLAHVRGEYERAASLVGESLALSRRLGLTTSMAAAMHNQAALAREQGDWPRALAAYEESLALERQAGNAWGIATSLTNLGALAVDQGDTSRAVALLQEGLALMRGLGDARGIASALHNLAAVRRDMGEWQRAADLHSESLALWRELGDRWGVAASLHDLARVTGRLSDGRRAAGLLAESLALFTELGVRQGTAACLEGLAAVALAADRPLDAARLLGAAEALREAIGAPLPARERQDLARIVAQARAAAKGGAFREAWLVGRELSADETAAFAQKLARGLAAVAAATPGEAELLTERERQVVGLVAEGLTNRQIATRLVISERTADRHLSNILGKLGLTTRAQVAAWSVAGRLRAAEAR